MAAFNGGQSSTSFRIPSEPCPVPSIDSDDESFVVLGKSLTSDFDEPNCHPVGASIVQEAKQLINKELSEIERSTIENCTKSEDDQSMPDEDVSKLSEHSVLPVMPDVKISIDETINNSTSIVNNTFSADLSSQELQSKIAQIIEENIHLKDTILQNNMSMKAQYERIVAWQEDVQKVHETHKSKLLEAKEIIDKLKKDNVCLKQEIERLNEKLLISKKIEENETVKTSIVENENAKSKLESLENLKIENETLKENSRKSIEEQERTIEEQRGRVQTLEQQVENLKNELEKSNIELIKTKSVESEKQKHLIDQLNNLRGELYLVQQRPLVGNHEEVAYLRHQLMSSQMALTQCEEARAAAYDQLETLTRKILQLEKDLIEARVESDDVFALKAQLDVYKADFEAERSAKETMKDEKAKMAEDLRNLHRRNQQLLDEVETLRGNDYVHVRRPTTRTYSSSSTSSAAENNQPKCPKCDFGFNTWQALENHVYRCIELDDVLP